MNLMLTALFPLLAAAADAALAPATIIVAAPAPVEAPAAAPTAEIAPDTSAAPAVQFAQLDPPDPLPAPDSTIAPPTGLAPMSEPDAAAAAIEVEAPAPPPATPALDRDVVLAKASASLEAASSAKGGFLQISPDGATARGDFYLRRPGRIRFEYADPTPLLIIADGATVAIEDKDLETVDRAPLSATPLDLLLKSRVNLAEDGDVIDVRRTDGRYHVELEDKTGEAEGRLILEFAEADFALNGWIAVEPSGGVTRVALYDVDTTAQLSPRLFVIEDPEDDEDRRR